MILYWETNPIYINLYRYSGLRLNNNVIKQFFSYKIRVQLFFTKSEITNIFKKMISLNVIWNLIIILGEHDWILVRLLLHRKISWKHNLGYMKSNSIEALYFACAFLQHTSQRFTSSIFSRDKNKVRWPR